LEIAIETIKRWTTTGDVAETALVPVEVIADVPGLGTGDHEFRLLKSGGSLHGDWQELTRGS